MKLNPVIQKKILTGLGEGHSFRQIAKRMQVSPTTVTVLANKLKEINIPINELLLLSNQELIDILQTGIARNIENCKPTPEFDYIND